MGFLPSSPPITSPLISLHFPLSQVEERSKLNRQGSPKICNTVSDTAIQSRSDSISQSGGGQATQTPPMQRPVEPQGGQGKVCWCSSGNVLVSVYFICMFSLVTTLQTFWSNTGLAQWRLRCLSFLSCITSCLIMLL